MSEEVTEVLGALESMIADQSIRCARIGSGSPFKFKRRTSLPAVHDLEVEQ